MGRRSTLRPLQQNAKFLLSYLPNHVNAIMEVFHCKRALHRISAGNEGWSHLQEDMSQIIFTSSHIAFFKHAMVVKLSGTC
jgi:hypothetical protein